jgi:tRNA(Ile)-lysidine synthase
MDVFKQVKKAIVEYELLTECDSILVALSGGPDSVALLHLLSRLRRPMRLSLAAVYINHQIRKRAAKREEAFCQDLCDRWGVDLDIVSEDIPDLAKKRKKGLEEAARQFRYDVFELLAVEDGHDRIALGHHADDRVETLLFRIIRGTGPSGLVGIPVRRGKIIRPLYDLTKGDILAYLDMQRLDYCIDRSNAGVDFRRNYIRNRLLAAIRKHLNPGVDRALLNLSENTLADERYLEQITEKAVKKAVRITPGGKIELDLELLTAYDASVRRRVLRRCMKTLSPESTVPDKEVIDRLERLCLGDDSTRSQGRAVSLPGRCQAVVADDKLVVFRRRRQPFMRQLELGQTCRLDLPAMDFRCRTPNLSAGKPIQKKRGSRKVTLDRSKLELPLVVRNIEAGDRFSPLGLGGSKKVGDYLTDRKVPVVYRDEVPIVCDARGIVWLVGQEIDDRVKVDEKTRKVVTIEVSIRKSGTASAV